MYFKNLYARERLTRASLKQELWHEIAEIRFLLLSCTAAGLSDAYYCSYVHFA